MALHIHVKKNWIEIQKKYDYPVNAVGIKIAGNDQATLKIWREEGIEKFMRR